MPVVVYSCLGHLFIHLCMAFYFVIVLALETDWGLPYHELVELWTLGALMIGAAALPAGMLGDRFGASAMMVVFFLGMGVCSILAGLANSTTTLFWGLTGIGVFASIYHPVGIPWLVRNTDANKGKALGFNGIFGSLGTAVAGLTAGGLIDLINWRAAFIAPGLLCVATGLALWWHVRSGRIADRAFHEEETSQAKSGDEDRVRVFLVLLITMFFASLIYNSTQTALPKLFELRHDGLAGEGALGIGILIAAVYTAAGVMQLLGGHLADRHPLKYVYLGALAVQVPLLWWAASQAGVPLLLIAKFMVMANVGALPAENMLLAAYTPARRHGLVFGLKFVLAFGVAPLAIQLVAVIAAKTGEFYWLFTLLALFALLALIVASRLPRPRTAEFEGRITGAGTTQGLQ